MSVELCVFLGIVLSGWLLFAFCLEYINNGKFTKKGKEINLKKKKCGVCSSQYFVSVFVDFWRCPLCGSINKER
jgi:ribosomal protein S27AE